MCHILSTKFLFSIPFQHLAALEDSLEGQRNANESLRNQLDETRQRELEDAEMSARLHEAEDEISKLRNMLQDQDRRAKVKRKMLEVRL